MQWSNTAEQNENVGVRTEDREMEESEEEEEDEEEEEEENHPPVGWHPNWGDACVIRGVAATLNLLIMHIFLSNKSILKKYWSNFSSRRALN